MENSGPITLFLAIWNEDYGPQVIEFYPKPTSYDLEDLSIRIFASFQFFYDVPDKNFSRILMKHQISNINRKALIILDIVNNPEIKGGLQPFIVVLLLPEFLSGDKLELFEILEHILLFNIFSAYK